MIPAWAYRGAPVACVNTDHVPNAQWGDIVGPEIGNHYHLTYIAVGVHGIIAVQLSEMGDMVLPDGTPYGFPLIWFRPLVSQNEDVALVKSLLRPIDPIRLADEYERSFEDAENALLRYTLP